MVIDFFKLIIFHIGRLISWLYRIFPICNNKIIFISFMGTQYSCNPKAITEALLKYNISKDIIWAFNRPSDFKGKINERITIVKHYSPKFFYHLLTSKVIVTNVDYLSFVRFRKSQIIINTWHGGGAYKKVGTQINSINALTKKRRESFLKRTNIFLSSSKAFTQLTLKKSFGFEGEIIECGMPRNDILMNQDEKRIHEIKDSLDIDLNCKVAIYAPTFRFDKKPGDYNLDIKRIKNALMTKFGADWIILYRLHPLIKSVENISADVIDVSEYSDMQELLLISDVLITDYSSSMWDFSLMGKPCFLYVTDLEIYKRDRDFYTDINSWPAVFSNSNDELEKAILNFDNNVFIDKVSKHHKDLGIMESGQATKNIGKRIVSFLEG